LNGLPLALTWEGYDDRLVSWDKKVIALKRLSFEEARSRAKRMAFDHLGKFWPRGKAPILDSFSIRGENFWMFFANGNVEVPEITSQQKQFSAYVVSDYGSCRQIRDMRWQPDRLREALHDLPIGFEKSRIKRQTGLGKAGASKGEQGLEVTGTGLKVGDVVVMRSGSRKMTVVESSKYGYVVCEWFIGGRVLRRSFLTGALSIVEE
jgi:uncharacterized protein YodC (DUF2158 family)